MFKLSPHLPSHATVVAYLALFLAMSGTAYAAATIDSTDVVDESIKSVDLKNGGAVKSEDVVNESLSGQDIKEGTLTKVPNADLLDGKDSTDFALAGDVRVGLLGDASQVRVGYENTVIPALEVGVAALAVYDMQGDYRCPDFPAENNGTLYLTLQGPGDLFIDQGETNPTYINVPDQNDFQTQLEATASGERFTIQYLKTAPGDPVMMTLLVFIVGVPGLAGVNHGTCHVQAQIIDNEGR